MEARSKLTAIGMALVLATATACVSGGVDQPSNGDGGGGTATTVYRAGTVAMSGDESFTYSDVVLTFESDPASVTIEATAGGATYTWIGGFTRAGDAVSTDPLPEASAGDQDLMILTGSTPSDTALTGTLTERYPKNGTTFEVSGGFSATRVQ
ncbi:MAG: hypothetical protein U0610_29065 [bacterium]